MLDQPNESTWFPWICPKSPESKFLNAALLSWMQGFWTARGSNNKSMEPSRHLKTFCLGENCFRPSRSDLIWFFDIFLQEIKKDSTFSCALGKLSSYVESNSNFLELGQQHPTMTGCRFISNLWLCDFGFHGSLNNAGIISLPSHLCWLPQLGTLQSSGSFHRLWSHTRAREVACPHRDHNENGLHNGQGSMYASMMPHKVP